MSQAAKEIGFGHSYPARECPQLPNPDGWRAGRDLAYGCWRQSRPFANPYPAGSDEWRGFEYGVYEHGSN